jgi:hypothetical protein
MAGLNTRSKDKENKEDNNKNNKLVPSSYSLAIINKVLSYYKLKKLLANFYPYYIPKNL